VDWDSQQRSETIEVLKTNGTVLASKSLNAGFEGGVYLVWNVTGHVRFRITNRGAINAVASGIFFGGARTGTTGPPAVTPPPPIPQLQTWQSRMLSGGTLFCNAAEISAAIGASGVVTEGNVWYYDGEKVFQQIAAYTKDPSWYACAGYVN
jgi:hypothetical protein